MNPGTGARVDGAVDFLYGFDLHRGQACGTVAVLALNHGRIESAKHTDSGSDRPFGYPAMP